MFYKLFPIFDPQNCGDVRERTVQTNSTSKTTTFFDDHRTTKQVTETVKSKCEKINYSPPTNSHDVVGWWYSFIRNVFGPIKEGALWFRHRLFSGHLLIGGAMESSAVARVAESVTFDTTERTSHPSPGSPEHRSTSTSISEDRVAPARAATDETIGGAPPTHPATAKYGSNTLTVPMEVWGGACPMPSLDTHGLGAVAMPNYENYPPPSRTMELDVGNCSPALDPSPRTGNAESSMLGGEKKDDPDVLKMRGLMGLCDPLRTRCRQPENVKRIRSLDVPQKRPGQACAQWFLNHKEGGGARPLPDPTENPYIKLWAGQGASTVPAKTPAPGATATNKDLAQEADDEDGYIRMIKAAPYPKHHSTIMGTKDRSPLPEASMKENVYDVVRAVGQRHYAIINVDGVSGSGKSHFINGTLKAHFASHYPEYGVLIIDQSHIFDMSGAGGLPTLYNVFKDLKKKKYMSAILFQIQILVALLRRVKEAIDSVELQKPIKKTFIIIEGGFISGSYIYNKNLMPDAVYNGMEQLMKEIYTSSGHHHEADLHILCGAGSIDRCRARIKSRNRDGEIKHYTPERLLQIHTNFTKFYEQDIPNNKFKIHCTSDTSWVGNIIKKLIIRTFGVL